MSGGGGDGGGCFRPAIPPIYPTYLSHPFATHTSDHSQPLRAREYLSTCTGTHKHFHVHLHKYTHENT